MDIDKIKDALADRLLNVVAEKTGLSRHTIANFKAGRGTPNSSTVKVLADYLGVKADE